MEWVKSLNPQQKALADKVVRAAEKYGVDPAFALSTAKAENDDFMHSVKRKSGKGAIGLMQIMPNTAKGLKIDPYNVDQNIDGGVRYLKENLDRYGGDKMLASVAYNYGPNSNFFKTGYMPNETRGYITRITKHGGYGDVPVGTMPTPPMQKISTGTQAMAEKKPSHGITLAPIDETDLSPWNPPTTTNEKVASRQVGIDDAIAAGTGGVAGVVAGHMLRPPTENEERQLSREARNELTANQQRIALAQAQAQADAQALGQTAPAQTTTPTQERGYGTKNWIYQEYPQHIGPTVESMNPNTKAHADELASVLSQGNKVVRNIPQGALPMQASPFSTFPSTMPPPAPPVAQTPNLGVAPTRANLANLAPPRQLTPAQLQMQVIANRAKNVGSGKVGGGIMGTIAGQQGYDAQQKFNQGDVFGGLTSGITSTGAALTMAPNPRFKALGAAATAAGGGLHLLQNIFNTEDQTKATLQPDGTPVKYKKGGAVKKPDGGLSAVEHFDGGGRTGLAKTVAGKIAGAFGQGPGQLIVPTAEEIAKFSAKPTRQLKFSEAIRPYQDQYLGVHMSDRQGVHGNRWGGTGFPNFQNINPLHAANKSVWMNDSEEAANRLIQSAREFNGRPMINTNYVGGLDQHKSNKTVFNDVLENFYRRQATGAIPEEQLNTINEAIRNLSKTQGTIKKRPFNDVFDIRDPDAVKAIAGTTFEGRKAISDILGKGEGTGRQFKQTPAVPDYWNIIDSHADPLTKGAPTSSVGTRLFSVDDVPAYFAKEELHPDYRWAVTGSDKQVQFPAVPQKVAVPDWYNKYYEKFKRDPHGNAWFSYPDQPQLISKDYITMAEDAGFAEGGQVQHFDRGGKVGGLTRLAESAYDILKLTPEKLESWRKANAKPYKQQQDPQLAQALEAYMTGKISQADYLRIMNERRPIRPLTEVPRAHSDTDIASALNRNQVEDKGILGVNLFAPQGMRVGNRLDIPAYERFGTYVDTMHDPSSGGKPIAYGHTGHLKNVEFQSDPNRAIRAGLGTREQGMTPLALEEGQGKAPFAMMVGDNQVTSNDEVRRMLAEALKDPTWRQIGMNPYRGSQFYDKADMQPVWSAAEKIQAGPLVLARDVEKTSWKDPRLKTKYGVNYAKGGLTHL
jgi:hypothetical protein